MIKLISKIFHKAYKMNRSATESRFLVSFSFLSNFRFCKDNVYCISDKKPWPCLTLSCHNWFCLDIIVTLMHFSIHEPVISTSFFNWQKCFKLLDPHRSLAYHYSCQWPFALSSRWQYVTLYIHIVLLGVFAIKDSHGCRPNIRFQSTYWVCKQCVTVPCNHIEHMLTISHTNQSIYVNHLS